MKMQTDEELYQLLREAAEHHIQVIIHAIGDATIDQVLSVYKRVIDELHLTDHRFHIEHFHTVTGDSRERAKSLGVIAGMQPTHAPNSASMALRRLGKERAAGAYAAAVSYTHLDVYKRQGQSCHSRRDSADQKLISIDIDSHGRRRNGRIPNRLHGPSCF